MKIEHLDEGVGRIVKGVNTTPDVGVNQTSIEAAKFGNKVDKDGRPPTLSSKVKGKSTNVLYNLGMVKEERYTALEWAIIEGGHSLDDLDKPTPTIAQLVRKHNVSAKQLLSQLAKGIEHEYEHTSDFDVAKEIALDHIADDPEYYDKLETIDEKWSAKYKRNINCNNPRGFSQRAHCAGRKKK